MPSAYYLNIGRQCGCRAVQRSPNWKEEINPKICQSAQGHYLAKVQVATVQLCNVNRPTPHDAGCV